MKGKYNPKFEKHFDVRIKTILFDETTDVTIFADFLEFEKNIHEVWTYLCEFSLLNDILLLAENGGDEIIKAISENIAVDQKSPTVIDVEEILGKALEINFVCFQVYKPQERNKDGILETVKDNCYYIDQIFSGENYQKVLDDEEKEMAEIVHQTELAEYNILLRQQYELYLSMMKKGFSKKEAKKIVGLKNKILFKIAKLNYLLIENKNLNK